MWLLEYPFSLKTTVIPVLLLVLRIELIYPISSFSEMKASFLRDILAEVEEKDTELG